MRRFLLLATAFFLLIVIGLPCAALYGVIYTQSGLRFVVNHLPQRYGKVGVRLQDVSGTIAGGAGARLLVIDQERVHLEIRGLHIRVKLEPLLWQTIDTPDTTISDVYIEIKRPTGPPSAPGHGGAPQFLPRWLAIYVGHANIGKVVLVVPGGTRLEWSGIAGSALVRHRDIRFYQAQVQMGDVGFALTGGLHASDPLRLSASGRIAWEPRGQPAWRLDANAAGDLDKLAVNGQLFAPFHGDVGGEMLDLTHHWHWQGEAAVRDFDLRAWHLTDALGAISGNLALSGEGQNFTASGTLDPAGLKAGSFDVLFDGGFSRQVLTARRIDITNIASGTRALASGAIGVAPVAGGPRLDLRGSWSNFRWPLAGRSVPFRSSQGSFELSGLRPYDFHTRGLAQVPTLLPGLAPVPADVSGKLGNDGVEFSRAQLDIFRGHADVHGEVTWAPLQRWDVGGQATGIDPAQLRPDLPGSVDFGLEVAGRGFKAGDPISLTLEGLRGRLRGLAASGGGNLTHAGDTWTFQQLRVGLGRTRLALDGSIDRSADLRFAVTAEDLSLISADGRGQLQADGSIHGPLDSPDIVATAHGTGVLYDGVSLAAFNAKVDFDPTSRRRSSIAAHLRQLRFRRRTMRSLDFTVDGPASGLTSHLEMQAPGLHLTATAGGGISGGIFSGRLESFDVSGAESLRLHLEQPVSLTLSRSASTIDRLCLIGSPGNLCALANRTPAAWSATLTASQLPLSTLTAGRTPAVEYLGTINVGTRLFGGGNSPAQGVLRIELHDAVLSRRLVSGRVERTPIGSSVLTATATPDSIDASASLTAGEIGTLAGTLRIGRGPQPWQDMPVTGELHAQTSKLDLVSVYLPDIDRAAGNLTANARIEGTIAKPQLSGNIRVAEGEVDFYQTNLHLRQIDMAAQLTDDGLMFDGTAQAGKGSVRAKGQLHWQDTLPYGQLHLDGTNLRVVDIPEAQIDASPSLDFKVAAHEVDITGSVAVPYARIVPTDLTGAVTSSSDEVIVGKESQNPANQFQVKTTITMKLGPNVNINTMGLTGQLAGSITVSSGYDAITRASGELSVQKGQYSAYARKLDIQSGRLIFTGGPIDDPGIEIRAVKRYPDVTAGINVRGTLQEPRLSFFSNPSLPQSQIVSLILSGGGGDSTLQMLQATAGQNQQSTAANELLTQGGAILAQQLGSRIGLPDISVETDLNNETSLVLGKYLSPRLYVSYGVGLTEELNAIRLRYSLGDHWTIRTTAGQIKGADLVFSVEK
ncbi:MAG TPA: translocation/assembly module TamB domain-containing protein [Steroidobacteraceae bacterium]|jgi:translocation and assembly module TamB|nr:translocation/assembly module TamB domain-containing protein [Steroidobacteraceae bacterium]